MPDEPVVTSPIDLLREAAAGPMPTDAVEYGITPKALPVTNSDTTPMRVKLTAQEWRHLYNEPEPPPEALAHGANVQGLLSRRISELEAERDYLRTAYDSAVKRIAQLEQHQRRPENDDHE